MRIALILAVVLATTAPAFGKGRGLFGFRQSGGCVNGQCSLPPQTVVTPAVVAAPVVVTAEPVVVTVKPWQARYGLRRACPIAVIPKALR